MVFLLVSAGVFRASKGDVAFGIGVLRLFTDRPEVYVPGFGTLTPGVNILTDFVRLLRYVSIFSCFDLFLILGLIPPLMDFFTLWCCLFLSSIEQASLSSYIRLISPNLLYVFYGAIGAHRKGGLGQDSRRNLTSHQNMAWHLWIGMFYKIGCVDGLGWDS